MTTKRNHKGRDDAKCKRSLSPSYFEKKAEALRKFFEKEDAQAEKDKSK